MTVFLFVLSVLFLAGLVLSASFVPRRSRFSQFELERRKLHNESTIRLDETREALYSDIVSLQRVLQAVLLVGFVLSSVGALGWLTGGAIAIIVSLEYGLLARIGFMRAFGMRMYGKYEVDILRVVARHGGIIRWIRTTLPVAENRGIDSREELQYLVNESQGVLGDHEKKLIVSSLGFDERLVREIMTPKSVVETVKSTEILGPLVLDDLHKTGHSRFPVINEDIDHVVGILYVRDVITLDTSKNHTSKVASAMSKRVYYIREDHTLDQALTAFLSTHHHMFIVINEFRETVGIVTLEDTLEALLGRRIVDEFDAHDDMRAVATRNASKKTAPNRSTESKDI
ncbi:CBS domain-containing protein [Candidatus Saccharibacteria bacterium]|nr:CBS domain-containing protein [Candidatus Saccharibacteria bacterium]